MKLLEDRILRDGCVIGDDILKVDSFINHQMDPELFHAMAVEWKRLFAGTGVNKILTIESSGIGIACIAGLEFGCPVVFAKKSRGRNMDGNIYRTEIASFTHNIVNTVGVDKKYITKEDRVLLIDDFLANGAALTGLADLVWQAGATLVGAGIAVEKAFEPGGDRVRSLGIRVESLARVASMNETDGIRFVEE